MDSIDRWMVPLKKAYLHLPYSIILLWLPKAPLAVVEVVVVALAPSQPHNLLLSALQKRGQGNRSSYDALLVMLLFMLMMMMMMMMMYDYV